jgi:hypothetical protein
MSELMAANGKLIVTHIYNQNKTYLPLELQQEKLKEKYTEMLSTRMPKERYELIWHCHDIKSNLKHELLDICNANKAFMLGIGYFGCKGSKASGKLSTAVEIASTNNTIPTLIVFP